MTYEFSCDDAGATCKWHTRAGDQDALLRDVSDHLKQKHNVQVVSNTLANYALRVAKQR